MTLSALTRSWPTLAAWGAALLQIGLGAGLITRGPDAVADGVGILLAVVGAAGLLWGIVALARGGMAAPRTGTAIGLAGTATAAAALIADPAGVSVYAASIAVILWLICGGAAAVAARRSSRRSAEDAGRPAPSPHVLGILVGAAAVAIAVVPALGAAEQSRVDAGQSSFMHDMSDMSGHGGH